MFPPIPDTGDNARRRYATHTDLDREKALAQRRADWRCGNIVYQVIVDRFVPSRRLDSKRQHYAAPRFLSSWEALPTRGQRLADAPCWSHEVHFYGGDLDSLRTRLDYLAELGVDVLYLNPIFQAYTNHKYDTMDYFTVDPQYGTREELRGLADDLHRMGMRLVLDGVFNHMGGMAPMFKAAQAAPPDAPERRFFVFGEEYRHGYRGWVNVANLPELNLEHPDVRRMIYDGPQSVVQTYLREADIDGWRLDVAHDIGFVFLNELTQNAHIAKPGSLVLGETWNYPEEWLRALDSVMNMHARLLMMRFANGKTTCLETGRLLDRMVADCGIEGLLRSHLVLDNHDVARLRHELPDRSERRLAQVLQFTLPGCPVIYYGSELGMEGGPDPANRAAMRWDLLTDDNEDLAFLRRLIGVRKSSAALRHGDFRLLDTGRLLAYARLTERVSESAFVVLNNTDQPQRDLIPLRSSKVMDADHLVCALTGDKVSVHCGTVEVEVPKREARIYIPTVELKGYSRYKRVY